MRQRLTVLTAAFICLVLAFGSVGAGQRDRDYSADRSKQAIVNGPPVVENQAIDIQATFDEYIAHPVYNFEIVIDPSATSAQASLDDAYKLLVMAHQQDDSDAVSSLTQLLRMNLPSGTRADKIRAGAHQRLSELYGHSTAKKVHHLGMAMQYTAGPGARAAIETQIADLGGDVFSLTFQPNGADVVTPKDFGVNDTCDDAIDANPLDFSGTVGDIESGDHNWVTFDIITGDPGVGQTVRIETSSNDMVMFDDTDLNLYSGCDAGVPTGFIEFDDDGGVDFMSLIERDCMGQGTYYLEVGGFANISTADNFNLDITVQGTGCFVRTPDAFEPDGDRANASQIGIDTPPNFPNAILTTRVAEEIQAHNIFPGGDEDLVKFQLSESSLMFLATSKVFPTIFNDFMGEPLPGFGEDTVIDLLPNMPSDYGGLCNQQVAPFVIDGNFPCRISNVGSDCPDPLSDPIPGFPDCLPWSLFGRPINTWPAENPLAIDDDSGPGLGSAITVCLPETDAINPFSSVSGPDYSWYLNSRGFSASQDFDYEVFVHNSAACRFELEPNNGLIQAPGQGQGSSNSGDGPAAAAANHLKLGQSMHGLNEFSVAQSIPGGLDSDIFTFNVPETQLVTFETFSPQGGADTELNVFVGPDPDGNFFFTGLSNDDGGPGLLSRIDANFPPACELLGTNCPNGKGSQNGNGQGWGLRKNPQYYVEVTTTNRFTDFPYELSSTVSAPAVIEEELNDDCETQGQEITPGDTVLASSGTSCDYDTYDFSLSENTLVSFDTVLGADDADTTIELTDAACDRIGCDDDGGVGLSSHIASCLPPGDYHLRVRAFSNILVFDYILESSGEAGCMPDIPPTTDGDGLFVCAGSLGGFDTCIPAEPPDFIEDPDNELSDCGGGNVAAVNIGDNVLAAISPACDFDAYSFTLAEDTQLDLHGFGGDITFQISEADCTKIACDDDSGSGGVSPYEPQITGCAAAGDYVLRVRPFTSVSVDPYTIEFNDDGPCDSTTDPGLSGDELFTCTDFDNGQGCSAP